MATQHSQDGLRFGEFEAGIGAQRTVIVPRGYGYGACGITGTMAAALSANSAVWAMRLDTGAQRRVFVECIRCKFTCLAAFTVPLTAARRLELFRGNGTANPAGGAAMVPVAKHGSADTSEVAPANGGDMRFATTGALTMTAITMETAPLRGASLIHVGNAGNFYDWTWGFSSTLNQPIQLDPGQVLAIRNPVVMDAAGTWALQVEVDWHEAPALDFVG